MSGVIPIKFKNGVSLKGVQAVTTLGMQMAARAFAEMGQKEMWITSVTDGTHKKGSFHYVGLAFDVRTRMFAEAEVEKLADVLKRILGNEWDVVVEATHIHIEFDPD